jgi:hypothetical protein
MLVTVATVSICGHMFSALWAWFCRCQIWKNIVEKKSGFLYILSYVNFTFLAPGCPGVLLDTFAMCLGGFVFANSSSQMQIWSLMARSFGQRPRAKSEFVCLCYAFSAKCFEPNAHLLAAGLHFCPDASSEIQIYSIMAYIFEGCFEPNAFFWFQMRWNLHTPRTKWPKHGLATIFENQMFGVTFFEKNVRILKCVFVLTFLM